MPYFSSLRRATLELIIEQYGNGFKSLRSYLDSLDVDKHGVNSIFIDETEINVRVKLWVA